MKISKVKDVVKDWIKSGYRFGNSFSNYLFGRLEASPKATKIGGTAFDLAAGGGLTYMAVTSAIGTVLSTAAAVLAVSTAPVAAAVSVPLGIIFLSLSCMTGGIGLGLLNAAREKIGIGKPSSYIRSARQAVSGAASSFKNALPFGKKASADFKNAADKTQGPKQAPARKPAFKGGFDL